MDRRREHLEAAVARGNLPFVVAMVARGDAPVWTGAAGHARPGAPAGPDTVFRLFSMTKAVGALAAAILVDRGALDLDAPVAAILPEFADVPLLAGWDGETPRLRRPRTPATVRHLATHTAGFAYGHWSAETQRYRAATGLPRKPSVDRAALFHPMLSEPGTAWRYGIGSDWLGLVVEAVAGVAIDAFCAREIFGPLGMASTAFALDDGLRARLADAWARGPDGAFVPTDHAPPAAPLFWGMGDALYGTPADYLQLLRLFVGRGESGGVRLVSAATGDALLANQIGALRVPRMVSAAPHLSADAELLAGVPKSHSLIGVRTEADAPGMRRAGSSGWAGLMNTHWWVDPAADVAGLFMTQALPFLDPAIQRAYETFERDCYA